MLASLERRRLGLENPALTQKIHRTLRTKDLELLTHRGFENSSQDAGRELYSLTIDSSENRYLLSSGDRGHIEIHDLNIACFNGPCQYKSVGKVTVINTLQVYCVEWYNVDNGAFFSAGSDGVLRLWNTNNMEVFFEVNFYDKIYNIAISPIANQHQLVAVAFNGKRREIALVDLRTGSSIHKLRNYQPSPLLVKWSTSKCHQLASAGIDSKCLLWDIRNASGPLITFSNSGDGASEQVNLAHDGAIKSIDFSANGKFLLTHGKDKKLSVWDTITGRHTGVNFGRIATSSPVTLAGRLAVSEYCTLAAIPSRNNLQIVDYSTGQRVKTLTGHVNQVTACAFNKECQDLYSVDSGGQILVWSHDRMSRQLLDHIQQDNWSDSE